jgi:hypothetical protein
MKAAIRDRFVLGHIVPSDAEDGGAPLLASLGHTSCSSLTTAAIVFWIGRF